MKTLRYERCSRDSHDQKFPVAAVLECSLPAAAPDPYSGRGFRTAFYRKWAVGLPLRAHRPVCHAWRVRPIACLLATAVLVAGCGSDSGPPSAAPKPADAARALGGSPPALAALHRQANRLLGGEADAFRARLRQLRGHPVVVNKWASWCGPCRAEFPFFQRLSTELGRRVAFIGVNSNDNDGDAGAFLKRYPVSYPSYSDPDQTVAKVFAAPLGFPSTAFYDARGKLTYVHQGGYSSAAKLREDIRFYAG